MQRSPASIDLKSVSKFVSDNAKLFGRFLTAAALIYIAWEISKTPSSIWLSLLHPTKVAALSGLILVYGASLLFVFVSWRLVLTKSGREKLDLSNSLDLYGDFQIQKYLPGNVLHQISRYSHLRKVGLSHKLVIWSSAMELAILIFVGLIVFALTLGLAMAREYLDQRVLWLLVGGGLAFLGCLGTFAYFQSTERGRFVQDLLGQIKAELPSILLATTAIAVFFVVTGSILFGLAHLIEEGDVSAGVSDVIGLNAFSWLAGFLTPGAPGGIGIREVVLVQTSSIQGSTDQMAAIAAVYRLVSVIGDFVFYLLAKLFSRLTRNRGLEA